MTQWMKKTRLARKGLALAALVGATLASPVWAQQVGTVVRVETDRGPIDIQLYDSDAPATVNNFLNYVRRGAFDGSFFHRLVKGFVMQGGGFKFDDAVRPHVSAVPADPAVVNEFNASRSNLRGTVAMAKLGGNPNSATNQWFVNLANNAANLDGQNGGFTVFGRVSAPGMVTVDAYAAGEVVNASNCITAMGTPASALGELPLGKALTTRSCDTILSEHLVIARSVRELPNRANASAADRIFNYIEAVYPQHAAPASQPTQTWEGYTYRYYPKTNAYAGTKGGRVFYLVPALSPNITDFASEAVLLAAAAAAGY